MSFVVPCDSPSKNSLLASPRENEPAVERGGPAFAAAAGLNAKRIGRTLDDIAQANIFVSDETWEAHLVRLAARCSILSCFFSHATVLLA